MFDISVETLWVKMHLYSLKTKIYFCCAQLVKWTVTVDTICPKPKRIMELLGSLPVF